MVVSQTRRLSSQTAVENRREIRKLRRQIKFSRQQRREAREHRERDIARRMVQRFYKHPAIYQIVFTYAYWQARKCGWDACHADVRGEYEPDESPFWVWWIGLHWQQRELMVSLSQLRLISG